jgi:flagellar hook assembly protein FlgD
LEQNYPNPFNPSTKINYTLPQSSNVKLTIYDALGHAVSTLVNESQNAGSYSIEWNAASFATGLYFYKLEAGSFTYTKQMILVK